MYGKQFFSVQGEGGIEESVRMNLEFAARVREKSQEIGLDIGFSIQPFIERSPDGAVHPGVYGTLELAKELDRVALRPLLLLSLPPVVIQQVDWLFHAHAIFFDAAPELKWQGNA